MTIYFISDLHLDNSQPQITEIFLRFLKQTAPKAEALYILGDLFEYWIGDDDKNPVAQQIISALHQLSQTGVALYFMHGNRDFLIGEQFSQQSGCTLLPDPVLINLYGTPTLLSHGDILCTADYKYQIFRFLVRNRLAKKFFLNKSLAKRHNIAKRMREKSGQKKKQRSPTIMDVTDKAVKKTMQRYHVQQLIHGHTHKPAIHSLQLNGQSAKRIVLGDWHQNSGSVLVCEMGKSPVLININ